MEKVKVSFLWPREVVEGMRERAKRNGRSFVGEIVYALREYIKQG